MLSPSLKQQIKCRWIEFRREPSAFFWVMFMPIMWMVALGFAFSDPKPESYGVGWSEGTISSMPQELRNSIETHPQLRLREGNEEALLRFIKRGDVSLLIKWQENKMSYHYFEWSH